MPPTPETHLHRLDLDGFRYYVKQRTTPEVIEFRVTTGSRDETEPQDHDCKKHMATLQAWLESVIAPSLTDGRELIIDASAIGMVYILPPGVGGPED